MEKKVRDLQATVIILAVLVVMLTVFLISEVVTHNETEDTEVVDTTETVDILHTETSSVEDVVDVSTPEPVNVDDLVEEVDYSNHNVKALEYVKKEIPKNIKGKTYQERQDPEKENSIIIPRQGGTFTLKNGILEFWEDGNLCGSGQIPEPADVSNIKFFRNDGAYTYSSWCALFSGNPYLDKDGNMVVLIIPDRRTIGKKELEIGYNILATNVEKIVDNMSETLSTDYIFKSKDGRYGFVALDTEGNVIKKVWLNKKNVEKLYFNFASSSSTYGGKKLLYWNLWITVKDYGRTGVLIYKPSKAIKIDNETAELLEGILGDFSIDQFDQRFEELLDKTKKAEFKN